MPTVLVIEDDTAICEAVAYNLEQDDHTVITAGDGVAGLELARSVQPDLVVLDVMLPRMSGLDVCRVLRSEQPVPILMLTARDGVADRVEGLGVGADDYLTKPFAMRELRARVESLLRRDRISREAGRPAGETTLGPIGDEGLTLDPVRHEVRREGEVIPLRPREFALLEFLMRHSGQVLTRARLLEEVWGYSYVGGERTVDVHIRWLRQKLEDEPSRPEHIVTVRGIGYRFVP